MVTADDDLRLGGLLTADAEYGPDFFRQYLGEKFDAAAECLGAFASDGFMTKDIAEQMLVDVLRTAGIGALLKGK